MVNIGGWLAKITGLILIAAGMLSFVPAFMVITNEPIWLFWLLKFPDTIRYSVIFIMAFGLVSILIEAGSKLYTLGNKALSGKQTQSTEHLATK